jgi:hypothetical protein
MAAISQQSGCFVYLIERSLLVGSLPFWVIDQLLG